MNEQTMVDHCQAATTFIGGLAVYADRMGLVAVFLVATWERFLRTREYNEAEEVGKKSLWV